jgi:transposase
MRRFVEGADRSQLALLPECLEDWVSEDNAVHVIDAFVEALDLRGMGFERVIAKETGQPSYHPAVLLKLYISVISIGCNPVGAWNVRRAAMSRLCG